MNKLNVAMAVSLACALAACSVGTRYTNPTSDLGTVKRVAVLPFENLAGDKIAGDRVHKIFLTELLATEAFTVVEPGEVMRAVRNGNYEIASLGIEDAKRLAAALKADALFLGTVVEYEDGRGAGAAPQVTLQLRLVDGTTGVTVWSTSDTRNGATVTAKLFGLGGRTASEVTRGMVQDELKALVH